jgi:hypothetical protein
VDAIVGFVDYVERQNKARKAKEEINARPVPGTIFKSLLLTMKGSKWKNEKTVPKEFNFNHRKVKVKALQRPVQNPAIFKFSDTV